MILIISRSLLCCFNHTCNYLMDYYHYSCFLLSCLMKSNNASHSISSDCICTKEDRKSSKTQYVRVECGENVSEQQRAENFLTLLNISNVAILSSLYVICIQKNKLLSFLCVFIPFSQSESFVRASIHVHYAITVIGKCNGWIWHVPHTEEWFCARPPWPRLWYLSM